MQMQEALQRRDIYLDKVETKTFTQDFQHMRNLYNAF